ncbi:MAG: HAD family phosphatase [Candidatus Micrarchaeota archaeon]
MKNTKAVVFDLDGVLLDTEGYQWQAWVEVLKPLGVALPREESFKYSGKHGTIIEEEIIKKYNLNAARGSLLEKKEKLVTEWFSSKKLELMPYAKESLEFFSARLPLAVASSGPREEVLLKLERSNLLHFFSTVVSGSEVARGKPFPDIYLLAVKKLGATPQECISFEDTQFGVESAKSAGLTCFAVPNAFSRAQDFSKADKVFKSLKEAVEAIINENLR